MRNANNAAFSAALANVSLAINELTAQRINVINVNLCPSTPTIAAGIHRDQAWIVRQIFPDTADTEFLELHARTRSLTRKKATAASGEATITGEPGTTLAAALEIKRDALSWFTTTEAVIGDDGVATIRVTSSSSGSAQNTTAAMSASLVSAPFGVDSSVTIGPLTGGTDDETDAALLARLLDLIRKPPAGGNERDYRRWAMEVDGVTAAYVYPLRRGLGTVDIAITSAGALAPAELIADVKAYIARLRPVTASDSLVITATEKFVDFNVEVAFSGVSLDDVSTQVDAIIRAVVARLAPGDPLVRSQVEAQILTISGVTDVNIAAPARNVEATVNELIVEWLRVGAITVTVMQ